MEVFLGKFTNWRIFQQATSWTLGKACRWSAWPIWCSMRLIGWGLDVETHGNTSECWWPGFAPTRMKTMVILASDHGDIFLGIQIKNLVFYKNPSCLEVRKKTNIMMISTRHHGCWLKICWILVTLYIFLSIFSLIHISRPSRPWRSLADLLDASHVCWVRQDAWGGICRRSGVHQQSGDWKDWGPARGAWLVSSMKKKSSTIN